MGRPNDDPRLSRSQGERTLLRNEDSGHTASRSMQANLRKYTASYLDVSLFLLIGC
jgi:hypothetical protein